MCVPIAFLKVTSDFHIVKKSNDHVLILISSAVPKSVLLKTSLLGFWTSLPVGFLSTLLSQPPNLLCWILLIMQPSSTEG